MRKNGICDEETKKDLWGKVLSDYMYRTYSSRLAKILEKNGSTVYKYSMEYAPAIHCLDQNLAFETKDGGELLCLDEETRQANLRVGQVIFAAYTNFICSGDPNGEGVPVWNEYRDAKDKENRYLQMCWDTESKEAPEPEDDTLSGFPEQVYRL